MTLTANTFQKTLLTWFDQHGRKSLPWQHNKTPYRVWISEIMLQQTQVSTVIPYFERFMHHFPTLAALANAHEDEVLHLWAGLGYYSRARNLLRAAKMVMEEYAGHFPATLDDMLRLPGIGPSTAGAILSIALNHPTAILDGNVKRVLTRLHGITSPVNEKTTEASLWEIAWRYTPKKRVAEYTQAIMDLGATLCTRSKPNCSACPFNKKCLAYQNDQVALIPMKTTTAKIPTRSATFLILKSGTDILLQKRPATGIWGSLFCLPEMEGNPSATSIRDYCQTQFRLNVVRSTPLPSFRHTFSHYHLEIFPIIIEIKKAPARIMEAGKQIWYNLYHPDAIGLPKPIQSILRGLT